LEHQLLVDKSQVSFQVACTEKRTAHTKTVVVKKAEETSKGSEWTGEE